MDGETFCKSQRKQIVTGLAEQCKTTKVKGPSGKLYKLLKEFDVTKLPQTMPINFDIDPSTHYNLWNGEEHIEQCNNLQILYIADNILTLQSNGISNEQKQAILSFLKHHNIDGQKLMNYERKQFGADLVAHCNDKKLKGKAVKLFKTLQSIHQ